MHNLEIELRLDPSEENARHLAAWPSLPKDAPGYIVLTSGRARLTIGGQTLAYRRGQLLLFAFGEDVPQGAMDWTLDYVGVFAERLAVATLEALGKRSGSAETGHTRGIIEGRGDEKTSAFAGFVDNPAGLWIGASGPTAEIAYRERELGPDLVRASLDSSEVHRKILEALQNIYLQILALNPRLERHPDVDRLGKLIGILARPNF